MKVDGGFGLGSFDFDAIGRSAQELESVGYDGAWSAETSHDPFFPLLIAAERTERIELGTGIVVAFARNPMTLANIANDLQAFSKGRFLLGLGSQIKPHIEKRFSMPWSHPAEVEMLKAGFDPSRPPFEVKKMLQPPWPAGSFLVRRVTSVLQSMVSSWTLTPALLSASAKTRFAAWKVG